MLNYQRVTWEKKTGWRWLEPWEFCGWLSRNSWEWKNMEKQSQLTNSMIFQRGGEKPPICLVVWNVNFIFPYIQSHVQYSFPHEITGWWFWATPLKNHGVSSSVGIVFSMGLYQVISQHYPNLWGFEGSVHYVQLTISHKIHGAGIYANMTGVYWWDPCYHI